MCSLPDVQIHLQEPIAHVILFAHYLPSPASRPLVTLPTTPGSFLGGQTMIMSELTDEGKEDGWSHTARTAGRCLASEDLTAAGNHQMPIGWVYCPSWTQITDGSTCPLPHHLPKANGKQETFWEQASERKLRRKDDGKEQVGIWTKDANCSQYFTPQNVFHGFPSLGILPH